MNATTVDRILALEAGTAHARFIASLSILFEEHFDEIGLPLSTEQIAALEELREAAA